MIYIYIYNVRKILHAACAADCLYKLSYAHALATEISLAICANARGQKSYVTDSLQKSVISNVHSLKTCATGNGLISKKCVISNGVLLRNR